MVCKRYENRQQRTHRRKARIVLPEHFFQKPLQVGSLQIIYPVSSFAVFCCTQSLDQAYSCSRISWLPQFANITSPGLLPACKSPPSLSSGTKHSAQWADLLMKAIHVRVSVYVIQKQPSRKWWKPKDMFLVSRVPLRKCLQWLQDACAVTHPPWNTFWSSSYLKQASQVGFAIGTQSQPFGFELDLPPCGNWRQWKPPVLTNCNNVCSQVAAASFFLW